LYDEIKAEVDIFESVGGFFRKLTGITGVSVATDNHLPPYIPPNVKSESILSSKDAQASGNRFIGYFSPFLNRFPISLNHFRVMDHG